MTTYVALGSSFAAGPGIAPVVHKGALRSGRNYPHQVAEQLSMRLIDVTCTGAKTVDILNAPQRTLRGRMGPQIDVVTPDAGLVTITVGGNDLDYLGTLTKGSLVNAAAKRLGFLPRNVTDRLRRSVDYVTPPERFDAVAAALAQVVRQVRIRAPRAQVVLVDYLTVLGPHAGECAQLPLSADQIDEVRRTAAGLAGAFHRAAVTSGADLVKASEASLEHGVCSADPWITGFHWGNPLAGGPIPYHPTLTGMTAIADLVVAQIAHTRAEGPASD